jgi:hypothetical protein
MCVCVCVCVCEQYNTETARQNTLKIKHFILIKKTKHLQKRIDTLAYIKLSRIKYINMITTRNLGKESIFFAWFTSQRFCPARPSLDLRSMANHQPVNACYCSQPSNLSYEPMQARLAGLSFTQDKNIHGPSSLKLLYWFVC